MEAEFLQVNISVDRKFRGTGCALLMSIRVSLQNRNLFILLYKLTTSRLLKVLKKLDSN